MVSISLKACFGCDESYLVSVDRENCYLSLEAKDAWIELSALARLSGFDPGIVSGYRNFSRQLAIWNDKAEGRRPLLDDNGRLVDVFSLSDEEKMHHILRWSALPGTSRHHWGTDFDIYDRSRMPEGYPIQLTPEETYGEGVFAPFHRWLDEYLARPDALFYRPYAVDLGGVAPEPWHLSFRPSAQKMETLLTLPALTSFLMDKPLVLKDVVLEHLPEIYNRYVVIESTCTN
jgi:LAS superfamily LD-carboxypeptidase LdcB